MGRRPSQKAEGKGGGLAVAEPAHRQLGCHGSAHPTAGAMYMAVRSRPPAHGPVLARLAKHQGPLLRAQPTETLKGGGPSCWPPCSSTTPTATPDAGEGAAKPDLPPPAPPAPPRSATDMTRMPRRLPPLGLRHAGKEGSRASANKRQMAVWNRDGFGGHIQISIQLRCNAEKRFCLIENSPGEAN